MPQDDRATPAGEPTNGSSTLQIMRTLDVALAGRYAIVRELGRGGMATVFLARDEKHGRDVAIKVLHPELAASIGVDRFEREIRLIASLQHPNILGLYDSGAVDGLLYYVMPFVDGESLRDRLDRVGQLPLDEAVRIALEIAAALGYAHQRSIVHRDIKPENILLTEDHTLVADFGIARVLSQAGHAKLTQTGMAMGTPLYMAPEQAGGEEVGPTADLYSLGCVFYEMLAGEPPFTGKNAVAIMARHAMEQVPSVRIVRSSVPEEVEEAIFRALEKVPADRPQTAAQFIDLLGIPFGSTGSMRVRLTASRRTPSGMHSMFFEPPAPPWWRRPVTAAAAVLTVFAAAGGAWWLASNEPAGPGLGPDARRVAVLYFADQSRDGSLAAVADGLTDGLIQALSTAPSLTVISRSGVEQYRRSPLAADSIARALRAGFLVRGEVEPESDRVRVSVRLDDQSGVNLRRASFVRPAAEVAALQDELTGVVADLIKQQLREEIAIRAQRATTANTTAWLLLQRGEQSRRSAEELMSLGNTEEASRAFAAADSLMSLAEGEDRRWAEPATRRAALAYRRSRLAGRDAVVIRRWVEAGSEHVERALALDPRNADALELRGNLRYWSWLVGLEPDASRARALLAQSKADLEQATMLNPRQAGAYATLSHLYYQTSNTTDVNIAAQRALEADEFLANADVILGRLFLSSYDLGQFDRAEHWCAEVQRRFPQHLLAVRCELYLLTTRVREPDVRAAWVLADSIVALTPAPVQALQRLTSDMLVAAVLARASRTQPSLADSAARVARRSEGNPIIDATRDLTYVGAFVYNVLGDKDNAFRLLRQYVAANPQRIPALRDDPGWWFREIERDPQYKQILGITDR